MLVRLFKRDTPNKLSTTEYASVEIGTTMACVTVITNGVESTHITNREQVRHAAACIDTLQKEYPGNKWRLVL
jgi:nitrous oxidase accessory protein NosD